MPDPSLANPLQNVVSFPQGPGDQLGRGVDTVLRALRTHLDMDVAFVTEFIADGRVFRNVDAKDPEHAPIHPGDVLSQEVGYCQRIVDGRLPELMPDTGAVPAAVVLPETAAVPVGAHVSVPIRLSDGRVYGTLCCFSFMPDPSLNARDLQMLRVFADLLSYQIDNHLIANEATQQKIVRVSTALSDHEPRIVYQPIFRLADGCITGMECLARFSGDPQRRPDLWFHEAAEVGMGVRLEVNAIHNALEGLPALPENCYLTINSSPATICSGEIDALLSSLPAERIVLEITEHDQVDDYAPLLAALAPLRKRGVRVAIDDAGAGHSSMRHILSIRPDIIKLDISLTRDIDRDSTRRALASALIVFASQTGSQIVAEGVETVDELTALQALGVVNAQGFYLSRPLPLPSALELINGAKDH